MGKPGTIHKRLKKKLEARKSVSKDDYYSASDILARAESSVDEYDYEMAHKYLQKVLEMDADNVKALELSATLLLENGNVMNARHCLGRAIAVQPDSGHAKYFSMAQLFDGNESLSFYRKGIGVLEDALEKEPNESALRELSNAYVSTAELFITDLCDGENAEGECFEAIRKAVQSDLTNPEALQMKARYFLIKEQFDDARSFMTESLNLWLPKYQSIRENAAPGGSVDPIETCSVPYDSRIGTAKICIELEQYEPATQILEGMLEEDDRVVDTWYLLGWLNRLRAAGGPDADDGYNGNARYYLTKAKETHKKTPTQDLDMVRHIEEILDELGSEPENDENENDEINFERELEMLDEEENVPMEN